MNETDADFTWTVEPAGLPLIARGCTSCHRKQLFECSERFRINANGRVLDVWLIYNCLHCDATFNLSILRRTNINEFDRNLLVKYERNDKQTVWQCGFNNGLIAGAGGRMHSDIDYTIKGTSVSLDIAQEQGLMIYVKLQFSFPLRIDNLLAKKFSCSRSEIEQIYYQGMLQIYPEKKRRRIRRKIRQSFLFAFRK
jgi:hypothetical protein